MAVDTTPNPFLTLAAFLLALAGLLALRINTGLPHPDQLMAALGNDSAMRLVSVRDLLAGQGWFDPMQSRLGPDGTPMHWSRLVDAPMAAILLLLAPMVGMDWAEYILLLAWPLILAAAMVAVASAIGRSLAGGLGALFVFIVTFLSLTVGWRSAFGDIDHHTVQLLLLFMALHGFLSRHDGRRHPVTAGLAIAASLCVGVETLPLLGALCLAFGVAWVARGDAERGPALAFSTALGGGFTVFFAGTAPAIAWRGGFCDAVSVDLGVPFVGGALVLGGLALWTSARTATYRAVMLGGGAVILVALTIAVVPACLTNPYDALDPYLVDRWLAHVSEAQNIAAIVLAGDKPRSLAAFGFAVAMIPFALVVDRRRMALPVILLAVAIAISAYQVRGSLHAMGLAAIVAGSTLGLLHIRARQIGSGEALRLSAAALILVIPFTFSLGIASGIWPALFGPDSGDMQQGGTERVAEAEMPQTCKNASDWVSLAGLPPGRVAATVDFGTPILRETPHSILSAPYHRNQSGMIAMLRIATAETDAEALERLTAMGVDYVVTCPTDTNLNLLAGRGEIGFLHRLSEGDAPTFLTPIPGDGPVAIWHVTPGQS